MKEKIKKTYLGSRSVYLTHLEPTVLMVVVVKSINKKYVSKQKKKKREKKPTCLTRLEPCSRGCGKMGGDL